MTLFDKIWSSHRITAIENGPDVLYIDRHFIHEVTSPQAFAGLNNRGITVRRADRTIATADHNVPTKNQHLPITEELSRKQVETLVQNCEEHNIDLYGLGHPYQGIVHVIGPELGITQPGMTIVCGDSHTSTHGAFGTIAFGIGTSEVEQVLATQSLLQQKPKQMRITIDGELNNGVTAKDLILFLLTKLSSSGATGYFIEYAGSTIRSLTMEGRMTVCNMSIEMGARGGLIEPDEVTFNYLNNRTFSPKEENWVSALEYWKTLYSDENSFFDKEYHFDASDITPWITYGTNPGMGMSITDNIPDPEISSNGKADNITKSLQYMGLKAGETLLGLRVNYVFIGSCTNARIEDLRQVAKLVDGKKKASNVNAFIVPGSNQVRKQAQQEGLETIFQQAGFELREPGCSACLGMNDDKIPKGEYCVSTSNRNFEGRQGPGARTLLASPLTAAATALSGVITDIRTII